MTAARIYKPETYRPEDNVALLMRRVINSFAVEADREMDPLGMTHAQWVPLYKLYLGQIDTAAGLARECQLDAGAMTRTLDRLEAKGLIRRIRSAEDRRVVHLELTDEGRSTAEQIPPVLCNVLNAHLKGFRMDDWQQLKTLLNRILDNAASLQGAREKESNET